MTMLLTIQLKDPSVVIESLTPEMAQGLIKAFGAFRTRGIPFVVTSGNDGQHAAHSARHPRSLHYEGRAIDVRLPSRYTHDTGTDAAMKYALAGQLGPSFDVVLEGDHLHLEFDPKSNAVA